MSIGAYYTLFRARDFGLPFEESIRSIAGQVDRVSVLVDSRSTDDTYAAVSRLASDNPKISVLLRDCPLNAKYPLAEWKNAARDELDTDWVLECDPFWMFPTHFVTLCESLLSGLAENVLVAGLGSLNFFNGDNIKHVHPKVLPILSRRIEGLIHGSPERQGCGLITGGGRSVQHSLSLADTSFRSGAPKDLHRTASLWVYNYEWYEIPCQYELKMLNHYLEGRATGVYSGIDAYEEDLDGNAVDLFDVTFRLPLDNYSIPLTDEMLDRSVKPIKVTHPEGMKDWIGRARVQPSNRLSATSLRRRAAKWAENRHRSEQEPETPPSQG
tara:strand:- start:1175 stop:2155 length:981 start_codon:yes stop_codon:yes gene_type:complete